jgi:hypothetical protein
MLSAVPSAAQDPSPVISACRAESTPSPGPQTGGNSDEQDTDKGPSGSHMFGVLPNYMTVERAGNIPPIGAHQKFKLASLETFDPYVYPFVALIASLNESYGSGARGYFKQYTASLTDTVTGNFMTTAVLPSILRQDPRYFERGSGGFLRRAGYAASRTVLTRGDSGRVQFNVSEIGGNAAAAALSNVYYPSADRTMSLTLSRLGLQVMWDALSNELKEFWPDVRRRIHGP